MREVVVVDYGSGNVHSMVNALGHAVTDQQRVTLTSDPEAIAAADRVVLPGVGAFASCRRKLAESGAEPGLSMARERGVPLLGVCVGMQVLADEGREFETSAGLGWLPGVVRRLDPGPTGKLPHIGWSPIDVSRPHPLLDGVGRDDWFYFVHSFALECREGDDVAATCEHGERFTAAVSRGSIAGTQFHPEKSGAAGLHLLANFCRWNPS